MEKWGFRYSTVAFEWLKLTRWPFKLVAHKFMGANVVGGSVELCLLGRRGNLKRKSKTVRRLIVSEIEQHSKKPTIARDRIVELFGNVPRVELFARQKIEGWDIWGNEVKSDIEL